MAVYASTDLRELGKGTLSLRRVWVLMQALPPHSQTYQLLSGNPDHLRGWTLEALLLGNAVDAINNLTYTVHSALGSKVDQPESVLPKPTGKHTAASNTDPQDIPVMTPSEVASALFGQDEHFILSQN